MWILIVFRHLKRQILKKPTLITVEATKTQLWVWRRSCSFNDDRHTPGGLSRLRLQTLWVGCHCQRPKMAAHGVDKGKSYWILSVHHIGYKRWLKNTEFLLSDCSKYIKNEDKQQSVYCLPLDIIFFLLPK